MKWENMRVLLVIKYVFVVVGVGMLAGTFFLYRNTTAFLGEAKIATGTVVELRQSRSGDADTYRPVVRFSTQEGEDITFTSSAGSKPPAYSKGEKVEVLYPPSLPAQARIKGFFSLWGAPAILGGLGSIFFLIGAGFFLVATFSRRKAEFLKAQGLPIQTSFQSVTLNEALSVNGRHPFRITTQWQNPATGDIHVFQSGNVWFDPTPFIDGGKITVFIERDKPGNYHLDLSFLPKLAE